MSKSPLRLCLHGPPKVGKTTFAAGFPGVLILDIDDGAAQCGARRVCLDSVPKVLKALDKIATGKTESPVDTVVLDTASQYIECIKREVESTRNKPFNTLGEFGWSELIRTWGLTLDALNACYKAGKHVVIVAHTDLRSISTVDGQDYDANVLALPPRVRQSIERWADVIGWCGFEREIEVISAHGGERHIVRGIKRVLRTSPEYGGGTRYNTIPDPLPLSFAEFWSHVQRLVE